MKEKETGHRLHWLVYLVLGYLGLVSITAIITRTPDFDIKEIIDTIISIMGAASPVLAVVSVILGLYSIGQANGGSKQMKDILAEASKSAESLAEVASQMAEIKAVLKKLRPESRPTSQYPPPVTPKKLVLPWDGYDVIV